MPALTPHGVCLLWQPGLLWTEAIADGATMLAYFSIPLALLWFVHKRHDLPHQWMAWLFVGFIVACGTTHGFDVLTLWVPAYQWQALAKVFTAALSIATAALLWPLVPKLLALPSPTQLALAAAELRQTLAQQLRTENQLRESENRLLAAQETLRQNNERLERRVADRTAELNALNATLAKSEARFRRVVEAAPSGLLIVGPAGTIDMVNPLAERMFGYNRAELVGGRVEMLVPPAQREGHPRLRASFLADPQSRPMGKGRSLFAQRRDGSQFEVEIALSPIETEDGLMVLAVVVDISARVKLEAQLRQSQKMQAIGQVTAGVAHDFNNLLQALGASLEMLGDLVGGQPEAADWVQMALRAARRGGEMTARLLSFSRQQRLVARPVPVAALFAEVAELIGHLFETRANEHNELVIEPGPEPLAVFADAGQLQAALLNLAVNARDAMTGGGRLSITARAAPADPAIVKPGRYTVIAVADTGTGMDATTLAQACDPFFTTKGQHGTGLGLSMVQGFAEQSGGAAHITSAPGQGTTVALWLPAADVPPPYPAADDLPALIKGRVLLVDDSSDVLVSVRAFLRQTGLEVTTAASGERAMTELRTGQRFDLLITDLGMPGLNGLDLLIQAHALHPQMPAIVITGYFSLTLPPGLERLVVVAKPFSRAELLGHVRRALWRTAEAAGTDRNGTPAP
jgi:PAS domain S-box-containing protein